MPTDPLPPSRVLGDAGHVTDHNELSVAMADFQAALTALQAVAVNIFHTTGGNVSAITDTITTFSKVNLPSGSRDSAADTIQVLYGAAKVFSLNGYGEVRLFPGAANHIPAIIQALASQTGDLLQLQSNSGQVLMKVAADGSMAAGPLTLQLSPGVAETRHAWDPLANGWLVKSPWTHAWVWKVASPPNCIQISAYLNAISASTSDGALVGTLPVNYRPASPHRVPVATDLLRIPPGGGINSEGGYFIIGTDGAIVCEGLAADATFASFDVLIPLDPM